MVPLEDCIKKEKPKIYVRKKYNKFIEFLIKLKLFKPKYNELNTKELNFFEEDI